MPFIVIRTKKPNCRYDIKGFGQELSAKMKIDIRRINIIMDYFDESDAFFGSESDSLIITLNLSETNTLDFKRQLIQTTATLSEKYFYKEKKSIAVICNLIKEGHMFLDNNFK
ncbi:MAG: hypothetical protein PHC91_00065 [Eubacteriales bacterium]|nr:hypothetical protein [Eubacteriales bacterium]